jgi:hypothetical protein
VTVICVWYSVFRKQHLDKNLLLKVHLITRLAIIGNTQWELMECREHLFSTQTVCE